MLKTSGKFLISDDGQLLKKRNPWPKILSALLITTIIILVIAFSKPNATNSHVFFKTLKNFFDFSDIKIGLAKITIQDTISESFKLLINTLMYSVLGTLFGIALSFPFAILSSKNIIEKKWIYIPFRALFSIIRSIPVIVIAFLVFNLVSATLAATVSISIFVMTLMTKWLYEELDSFDLETYHSLKSFGASSYRALMKSVLPFLVRKAISYGVYSFEIVIRFATILGMVGIPTIGSLLTSKYKEINYWGHMTIVLIILIITIALIEIISWAITKYLIEYKQKSVTIDKNLSFIEKVKAIKENKSKIVYYQIGFIFILFVVAILAITKVEWKMANSYKLEQFKINIANIFKPNSDLLWDFSDANNAIKLGGEAMLMISSSVIIGTIFGTIIGIMASRNITGNYVAWPMKILVIAIRSIPTVVYAIVFVLMVDITKPTWAGSLALGVHSIGMIGKLTYEKIESLDKGTQDALAVAGANKILVTRWGVISEAIPSIMSNALYRFEINFKSAVEVGSVGASMFGWQFKIYSSDPTQYRNLSSYLIVTIVIVLFFEQISSLLRKKLLTGYFFEKNSLFAKLKMNTIENFMFMVNINYAKQLDSKKYTSSYYLYELRNSKVSYWRILRELFRFNTKLKKETKLIKKAEIMKFEDALKDIDVSDENAIIKYRKAIAKMKKLRLNKFKKKAFQKMVNHV